MENKLDKLFRDKLEQHSIAPSAHAWEKVATSFPKKNNTWALSWRIAAAVAVMAVAGWFAFDFGKDVTVEMANDKTVEQPKVDQPNQDPSQNVATQNESKEAKKVAEDNHPTSIQRTVAKSNSVKPKEIQKQGVNEIEIEDLTKDIQLEQTIASVEEVTEPVDLQEQIEKPAPTKSMVIVYNLAPVEKKQEVEPAKPNTLKRVLEFAKDVKSGEATTFASVRNWKDNLLGSEELTRVEKQNNE